MMLNWRRVLYDAASAAVKACDAAIREEISRPASTPTSDAAPPTEPSGPSADVTMTASPPAPEPALDELPRLFREHADQVLRHLHEFMTQLGASLTSLHPDRERLVEEVLRAYKAQIDQATCEAVQRLVHLPPRLGDFRSLRTLDPSMRSDLERLFAGENRSSRAALELLWGFLLAHEHGEREAVRGNASELVQWVAERRVLDTAITVISHGRALQWLAKRTPIVAKAGKAPARGLVWVVHLDWLSKPPARYFLDACEAAE